MDGRLTRIRARDPLAPSELLTAAAASSALGEVAACRAPSRAA